MRKIVLIALIFGMIFTLAFSFQISLKDIYMEWFEPSNINMWTTQWMLPVLYKEASNTTVVNAYYRNESENNTLNIIGIYGFDKFIGGDYMKATVKASYTTFTFNRYTIGIALPNTGFDIRYVNVLDSNSQYYNEIGMDFEFIYRNSHIKIGNAESTIFSYCKFFNFVRYLKPSWPEDSPWQSIWSFDYLMRTVWMLPQFAFVYDSYSGTDEITYQDQSSNVIELLVKPFYNIVLRGGVDFENTGSKAIPSVNIGARIVFGKYNIDTDYQRALAENKGTFAISAGMNF